MSNHQITYEKCIELCVELATRSRLLTKISQCDDLAQRQVVSLFTARINQVAKYREKFGLGLLDDKSDLTVLFI